jgi:BolA protein
VTGPKRPELIRHRLEAAFEPVELEIIDESHLHAGHPGAESGKGHFRVQIASTSFRGLRAVQCHRLVFDALGDLMETDIHALSLTVRVPPQVHSGSHSED